MIFREFIYPFILSSIETRSENDSHSSFRKFSLSILVVVLVLVF